MPYDKRAGEIRDLLVGVRMTDPLHAAEYINPLLQ